MNHSCSLEEEQSATGLMHHNTSITAAAAISTTNTAIPAPAPVRILQLILLLLPPLTVMLIMNPFIFH